MLFVLTWVGSVIQVFLFENDIIGWLSWRLPLSLRKGGTGQTTRSKEVLKPVWWCSNRKEICLGQSLNFNVCERDVNK